MTRLLLVRHGESTWNALRTLQGQADPPLSQLGLSQVAALTDHVKQYSPTHAVASDLSRARETAALLGFESARLDPLWREVDVGLWSGESIEQLKAKHPVEYQGWRDGTATPPEGESWETFCQRIEQALAPVLAAGGCQLVVTHGGVVRAALATLLDLQPHSIVPVSPASLTVIDCIGKPRLRAFNVTGYSASLDPPD